MAKLLISKAMLLGLLALCTAGCSWGRFDDITEAAPIVMLKKPKAMSAGFAVSTVAVANEERSLLLVGGATGASAAASYDLGQGTSPTLDATSTEYCDGSKGVCFLAQPPTALRHVELLTPDGPETHDLCFPLGVGETPVQGNGLAMRCDDGVLFSYPLPDSFIEDADFAIEALQGEILSLSGEDAESPWLLSAVASHTLSWFYRYGSTTPEVIAPPGEVPLDYGKVVHALASGTNHLMTVAAPDSGRVYLFRASDLAVDYIGCLATGPGFGRAIASGVVLADDAVPDLVVSDARAVHVFDGQKLLDLPPTSGNVCSLAALPEGGLISSFTCGATGDVTGCPSSKFGEAVGVGDLDGDGDGEVVVGAPAMTVREKATAGAVLVWDMEERGETTMAEANFISSAEDNDQLGAALALPRVGERNIIAAGAPGTGKVALFYCSGLVPEGQGGKRCK